MKLLVWNETEDQSHLVEIVDDVSEKVKNDLSGGELGELLEEHKIDVDSILIAEMDPAFTCPLGSVLRNMTCGEH